MQDATAVKEQMESQEQQGQRLVSDANAIEWQERKQEEQRQKLNFDANVPPTIYRAVVSYGKVGRNGIILLQNRVSVLQSLL